MTRLPTVAGLLASAALYALSASPLAAQTTVRETISDSDPVVSSVFGTCREPQPQLFPGTGFWYDRFDAWVINTRPGEEYVRTTLADEEVGTMVLELGDGSGTTPQTYFERVRTTFTPRSRRTVILVFSPHTTPYSLSVRHEASGRDLSITPARELPALWVRETCGRGAPAGGRVSTTTRPGPTFSYDMPDRWMFDYWGDFGRMAYLDGDVIASMIGMGVGVRYQMGLSPSTALTFGGEGLFQFPSGPDGDDSLLEDASSHALRGFLGLNWDDVLEVRYGMIGRALAGSRDGDVVYGGTGLLFRDGGHARLTLDLGGLGVRGDAYTTFGILTGTDDAAGALDETVYRVQLLFGPDHGLGAGIGIHDLEYAPPAGRMLDGRGASFFFGVSF